MAIENSSSQLDQIQAIQQVIEALRDDNIVVKLTERLTAKLNKGPTHSASDFLYNSGLPCSLKVGWNNAGQFEVVFFNTLKLAIDPFLDSPADFPERVISELQRLEESILARYGVLCDPNVLIGYISSQSEEIVSELLKIVNRGYPHKGELAIIFSRDGDLVFDEIKFNKEKSPLLGGLLPSVHALMEYDKDKDKTITLSIRAFSGGKACYESCLLIPGKDQEVLVRTVRESIIPSLKDHLSEYGNSV